ncbi:MAG: SDR family NAD(P)-dependent oxidoreductase [Actinobacteria bacterium]|nr:SDR family NAD(P)-dependent oxidoreductase [Actinomycetota bacterium]MSX79419.1 SDR family NAD(P)-dependent oxidoreductase [Actinomycetota bacterium]MSY11896.1 SDR family NAD(P)-dependent oxidoreductase [Actinomycetota bacterium]MSZ04274.1 SDR family NAD(P)-dependent oxidoreductase [Actinomycetota bacterium]MTB06547.1 SDR family NAD(P)-dependent oxidoreductase [Actinomycetota bacterium]
MTDVGFDGKVAIITGAGGGLGRQHALLLARRGALVVVNDLGGAVDGTGENASAAQKVVDEIKAAGGEAVADHNSVATPEGGAAIVQTAIDTYGKVDIVINNAGILRDKAFHNMGPDLMNPVFDVHLKGAFHVTQPAFVKMREQGYGRIISTSSAAGVFGNFGQTNYGAAKMGLVGFTRVLAVEGARYNIKANAIAPLALTRMTENIMAGGLADVLQPGLVSPIVAYLASEECPVSGNIYSVGGGRVAEVFIGETQGYHKSDLTLEDVRDNFDQIRNRDGYAVPMGLAEETALFLPFFKS